MARKRVLGSAIPVYLVDGESGDVVGATSPLPTSSGGGGGASDVVITEPIGQQLMVASVSVAIASNQSSIPTTVSAALPVGDNNIGNVDVVTLPAIPAGNNNIGDVDVLSIVPGTAATSLGKAEDAVHASGDTGIMGLGVRTDTPAPLAANGDYVPNIYDSTNLHWTREGYQPVYEDNTAGKAIVEHRYTPLRVTADTQVKATSGFVHTINIAPTGTVTAGVLTIYDSAAESGTIIYSCSLPITTFQPFTVVLNAIFATGIYVGFDGTLANVQATVSYR